jgi:hypothetical protein
MSTWLIHSVAAGLTLALAVLPPDVCSLLTEEEAEAILGTKLGPPQPQSNGDCWYLREGGAGIAAVELILSVLPVQMRSEAEFDQFITEQMKSINEQMEKEGMKEFSLQRVEGVGAPGVFPRSGAVCAAGFADPGDRNRPAEGGGDRGEGAPPVQVSRGEEWAITYMHLDQVGSIR